MVNMNKHIDPCVYVLHSGDGVIAYVGSTSKNALNRLWEHNYRARSGHAAPVYEWMREVGVEAVTVEVLHREADREKREALEVKTILRLLSEGHPLRNQVSSDGKRNSMSQLSRDRIGLANRGKEPWTKGKRGEAAGWTEQRRREQSERMKERGKVA